VSALVKNIHKKLTTINEENYGRLKKTG